MALPNGVGTRRRPRGSPSPTATPVPIPKPQPLPRLSTPVPAFVTGYRRRAEVEQNRKRREDEARLRRLQEGFARLRGLEAPPPPTRPSRLDVTEFPGVPSAISDSVGAPIGLTRDYISLRGGTPDPLETPEEKVRHMVLRRIGTMVRAGRGPDEAYDMAVRELEPALQDILFGDPDMGDRLMRTIIRGVSPIAKGTGEVLGTVQDAVNTALRFRGLAGILEGKPTLVPPEEAPQLDILHGEGGLEQGVRAFEQSTEQVKPFYKDIVLPALSQPFLAGEEAFETVTGVRTGHRVSKAIRSDTAAEITASLINPVALAMVLPTAGTGVALAGGRIPALAQITSNLIGTGLEPAAVRLLTWGVVTAARLPPRLVLRGLARGTIKALNEETAVRLLAGLSDKPEPILAGGFLRGLSRLIMSEGKDPYDVGRALGRAMLDQAPDEPAVVAGELVRGTQVRGLTNDGEELSGELLTLGERTASIQTELGPRIVVRESLRTTGATPAAVVEAVADTGPTLKKGRRVTVLSGKHRTKVGEVLGYDGGTGQYRVRLDDGSELSLRRKSIATPKEAEQEAETLAALTGRTEREADGLGRITNADEAGEEARRVAQKTAQGEAGGGPPAELPDAPPTLPASDPVVPHPNELRDDTRHLVSLYRLAVRNEDAIMHALEEATRHIIRPALVDKKTGLVGAARAKKPGQSLHWNDVFSDPDAYDWINPLAREAVDKYTAGTHAIVQRLVDEGIVPKKFLRFIKPSGKRFVHRMVVQIGDEVVRGGPRRGSIGLKQSFQFPRTRPLAGGEGAVPVTYVNDPASVLAEFSAEAGYAIASRRLARGLDKYALVVRASEETRVALETTTEAGRTVQRKLARLESKRQGLLELEDAAKGAGKRRLQGLRKKVVAEASDLRTRLEGLQKEKRRLQARAKRERATFSSREPSFEHLPMAFAGRKLYPKTLIREVERGTRLPSGPFIGPVVGVLRAARDINALFKPIWASGDLSFIGLQTLPALGVNPAAWAEMVAMATTSVLHPQVYEAFVAKRLPLIQQMVADGVPFYGSEFAFEQAFQGPFGPQVQAFFNSNLNPYKALKIGNDAWNRALNVISVHLYEQGLAIIDDVGGLTFGKLAAKAFGPGVVGKGLSARQQLAATIAHGTGRLSLQELSKRGPVFNLVMQALPFAGQYWEGYLRLIGDALLHGGMRGNLGRRLLAGWAASAIGLYTVIAYASGQEPKLDPRKYGAQVLTLRVGDQNVGIGGPLQQLMLLAGRVADDPGEAHNLVVNFLRGKASPAVSLFVDMLLEREDFVGNRLDSWNARYAYMASRLVPFAAQEIVGEAMRDFLAGESPGEILLDPARFSPQKFVPELLGGRSFPVSFRTIVHEVALEEWRASNPGSDLTDDEIIEGVLPLMRDDKKNFPQTYAANQEYEESRRRRDETWQKIADAADKHKQEVRDPALDKLAEGIQWNRPGGGQIYRELASGVISNATSVIDSLPAQHGVNPDDLPEKETRIARLIERYHNTDLENFRTPDGLELDYKAWKAERERILGLLPPEIAEKVRAGKGEYSIPRVADTQRRFDNAKKALEQWYEFPKYKGLDKEESAFVDKLVSFSRKVSEMLSLMGVPGSIGGADIILQIISTVRPEWGKYVSYARVARRPALSELLRNTDKPKWVLSHPDLAVFYSFTYDDLTDDDKLEWQQLYSLR